MSEDGKCRWRARLGAFGRVANRDPAWLVSIVVATIGLLSPYFRPGGPGLGSGYSTWNLNRDEGTILYEALRIASGQVIYRDFFHFHGPVPYYLLAALFKIVGPSVIAARVLSAGVLGIGAACLAVIVARPLGRLAGTGAAAILVAAMVPVYPSVYAHWFALTFGLAALALLTGQGSARSGRQFGAGALLALALASTQSLGLPILVAAVGTAVLPGLAARSLAAALRAPARIACGAASVLGSIAAAFAAAKGLPQLMYGMFVFPFTRYAPGQPDDEYGAYRFTSYPEPGEPWYTMAFVSRELVHYLPFMALVAGLVVGATALYRLYARRTGYADVVVAGLATAAVTPLFIGGARRDLIHVAFVGAFGLCGIAAMADCFGRNARKLAAPVMAIVGGLALVSHLHKTHATWADSRRFSSFHHEFLARVPASREITRHTKADDAIVAGFLGGWTYWFTARHTPLRHTFIPEAPQAYMAYFDSAMWKETAEKILVARPRALLLNPEQWRMIRQSRPDLETLYQPRFAPGLLWHSE